LQKAGLFLLLVFFIIFLSIAIFTLNSDFITLAIFTFLLFILDNISILFFEKPQIKCIRKISTVNSGILDENTNENIDENANENVVENIDEKIESKKNRFIRDQNVLITVEIEIKFKRKFFFNLLEIIPKALAESNNISIIKNKYLFIPDKSMKFNYSYNLKLKRGSYEFEPIQMEVFSLFALSKKTYSLAAPLNFFVLPSEAVDIELPIKSKKLSIYAGNIPSQKAGLGLNFLDVRKYYEGDKLNQINWKHSARNDELYVNEFERESNTDVSIIIDCRNNENYSTSPQIFEKGIDAAYSIAKSMLRAQNRVSLLEFGSFFNYLRPAYGKIQLERISLALANIKISEQKDFWELDAIPQEIIPSQSLVFLITPLSDEDIPHIIKFHQKKYRFVIIALDIAEYLYKISREEEKLKLKNAYLLAKSLRMITIETAKKAGAIVLNYDCITPFNEFIKDNLEYLKQLTRKIGRI